MPDILTREQRHRNMAAIRSSSTKAEIALAHSLYHKGYRYKKNCRNLPGTPDIVLPKYRTAIFVHGCFWHGHKDCKYYTVPKTNTDFWKAKVARNQERDQEVWRQLEAKGWFVIIVWECQLKKAHLAETVEAVSAEIRRNGETLKKAKEERKKAQEVWLQMRKARREREAALNAELWNS